MKKWIVGLIPGSAHASGSVIPDPILWILIFLGTPWMWGTLIAVIAVLAYLGIRKKDKT